MSEILIESVDFQSVVNEVIEEAAAAAKNYYIRGPYLESETRNGNGRIYPKSIIDREVKTMMEGKIKQNRCLGELGHPATSEINLDRCSHLIKNLQMEDKVGVGNSLVMSTPMGNIAKAFIDSGVRLGVSSRGIGTLKESVVQNDYRLITIDIVADPSAPSAFVDGILESRTEWVLKEGILVERDVEELKTQLDTLTVQDKANAVVRVFEEAMSRIADGVKGKIITIQK